MRYPSILLRCLFFFSFFAPDEGKRPLGGRKKFHHFVRQMRHVFSKPSKSIPSGKILASATISPQSPTLKPPKGITSRLTTALNRYALTGALSWYQITPTPEPKVPVQRFSRIHTAANPKTPPAHPAMNAHPSPCYIQLAKTNQKRNTTEVPTQLGKKYWQITSDGAFKTPLGKRC